MTKKLRILAGAALILSIASCSSSSADDGAGDSSTSVAASGKFNDADVMFAQMMIPHHEQAIELSDIALDPTMGAGDAVIALATQIKGAQDPEISMMKSLLVSWGKSTEMDSSMDHGSMMSGMLSADELEQLGTLRGEEFDRAWMQAMIAHHEGAIEMADDVLADGSHPETQTLAKAIVSGQQTEIDEMKRLLG